MVHSWAMLFQQLTEEGDGQGWSDCLVRFVRGMGIENPTMEREVILISIHRDRAFSYGERVWTKKLLVEMNHIPFWNTIIYVSRLSSQLEMRSEGNSFLHWISLMWKWKDVKFIHQSCVLLCSVRCLVPSERKAELAPNHEIQESARSSSFHSFLGLLRLQLDLRCDQTKCEIGSRKQEGQPLIVR